MGSLQLHASFRRFGPALLLILFGASLAACGGSDDDNGDGSGGNPPGPPPPPPPTLPTLSPTPISLDDDHQVGVDHWPNGNTSTGGQGQDIGAMTCLASQSNTFHQHTHVSVFLNGEQLSFPAMVGFVTGSSPASDCHYPLHTHDKSGLIHQHGTSPQNFTLGQVFQVWGQPLSTTNFASETGLPIVVYVTDGSTVTVASGNWADIPLNSHREITVQIGTAITEIPNYTWTGN